LTAEPTISDVLAAIAGLGERIGSLEARIGSLEARMGALEEEVKDIRAHLKAQPDMRLMFANGKITLEKIVEIEGEIRMLRSAINDHARENVTPGEIAAVHHDLSVLQRGRLEAEGRLLRIEEVLHLTTP
jgi:chromosome segregation ATPase